MLWPTRRQALTQTSDLQGKQTAKRRVFSLRNERLGLALLSHQRNISRWLRPANLPVTFAHMSAVGRRQTGGRVASHIHSRLWTGSSRLPRGHNLQGRVCRGSRTRRLASPEGLLPFWVVDQPDAASVVHLTHF